MQGEFCSTDRPTALHQEMSDHGSCWRVGPFDFNFFFVLSRKSTGFPLNFLLRVNSYQGLTWFPVAGRISQILLSTLFGEGFRFL